MAKVGILALQGAFIEHKKILESLGAECVEIRQKKDLKDLAGIVLPGGESTVQGQLLHKLDLFTPVQEKILSGLPVLATCAGLILLAQSIEGSGYTACYRASKCVRTAAWQFCRGLSYERLRSVPYGLYPCALYCRDLSPGGCAGFRRRPPGGSQI